MQLEKNAPIAGTWRLGCRDRRERGVGVLGDVRNRRPPRAHFSGVRRVLGAPAPDPRQSPRSYRDPRRRPGPTVGAGALTRTRSPVIASGPQIDTRPNPRRRRSPTLWWCFDLPPAILTGPYRPVDRDGIPAEVEVLSRLAEVFSRPDGRSDTFAHGRKRRSPPVL
jgi:hypothetical protein